MKCIYCNSETELTKSDIITSAITGTKLTKCFVCNKHNAFTNESYEKKFVSNLDFFRNLLGFLTRKGEKEISYIADISICGIEIHNTKISNNESIYAPKKIVKGFGNDGKKILRGSIKELEKIGKVQSKVIDNTSNFNVSKTIKADCFLGFYALHSIAKMAYEWYCYINEIEEFKEENTEIVEYILGKRDDDFVDIITDGSYYNAINNISESGTNTFFQYDDVDGYRYVVFNFWKIISYRVKICKLQQRQSNTNRLLSFRLYLYHTDDRKTEEKLEVPFDDTKNLIFITKKPQDIEVDIWSYFSMRMGKVMSELPITIKGLKNDVDKLSKELERYNKKEIKAAELLQYGEYKVLITIYIINQLHCNKDKYDITKSFDDNLDMLLDFANNPINTQEEINKFKEYLSKLDMQERLYKCIFDGICAFNEMYKNDKLLKKDF